MVMLMVCMCVWRGCYVTLSEIAVHVILFIEETFLCRQRLGNNNMREMPRVGGGSAGVREKVSISEFVEG